MNTDEEFFQAFIRAFNALDMAAFRGCLAADVSLFAPGDGEHPLIEGAEAVEAHFSRVFAAEGSAGPNIRPRNVRAHALADGAMLITFEFPRAGGSTGRRTLVLRRVAGDWKLVHIHASNAVALRDDAGTWDHHAVRR